MSGGTRLAPTGIMKNRKAIGNIIFISSLRPNKTQMDIGINAIKANCWVTFTLIMKERNQSSNATANTTNAKGSAAVSGGRYGLPLSI